MEVRRVSTAGTFRLHARQPFLSQALRNEHIGLEEVADGIWNIVHNSTLLGKIDERSLRRQLVLIALIIAFIIGLALSY